MRVSQGMVAAVTAAWMALASGCVSLDKYKQLEMSQRKLEAEKAQIEQELYDARNNNENLRGSLTAEKDKLRSKDMLIESLKQENDQLGQHAEEMARTARSLQEALDRQTLQEPILIETRLPAELNDVLKDFASRYPNQVVYDAKRGIVKWTSDLLFALGSDAVRDTAKEALAGFADVVKSPAASGFDVLIVGHTDDRPIARAETKQKHPTNWHLSVHRAISVSNVLQSHGVEPTRIGVMGFGEYRPVEPNTSEEGRSHNRRVEIYLVPAGSVGGVVVPKPAESSTQRVDPTAQQPEDEGIK